MSTEGNKAIVRRLYKSFEVNDQAGMLEVLSPDLVARTHGSPDPQTREAMLQSIRDWNAAFSDTRFEIAEQIAEGDSVTTRGVFRTKHNRGDFMGAKPTGKSVAVEFSSVERFRDGQIVERHVSNDFHGMLQQLGIVPPPQGGQ